MASLEQSLQELDVIELDIVRQNLHRWLGHYAAQHRELLPSVEAMIRSPAEAFQVDWRIAEDIRTITDPLLGRIFWLLPGLIELAKSAHKPDAANSPLPHALFRDEVIGKFDAQLKPLLISLVANDSNDLSDFYDRGPAVHAGNVRIWREAVTAAERDRADSEERNMFHKTHRLLHHLNSYFAHCGLLLDMSPNADRLSPEVFRERFGDLLRMNIIQQIFIAPSATGDMQTYSLYPILFRRTKSTAYADYLSDSVRVDKRSFQFYHETIEEHAKLPVEEDFLESDPETRITLEHLRWMHARHPDICQREQVDYARIHVEELRHLLDIRRTLKGSTLYERIGDTLLRPESALRNELWPEITQDVDGETTFRQESDIELARALIETSGQLTAAAISPDPALIAHEWKKSLRVRLECENRELMRHDHAVEIITILLAGQLELVRNVSFSPAKRPLLQRILAWRPGKKKAMQFGDHDLTALHALSTTIASFAENHPAPFRLASKGAFGQFQSQIDELPFARLTDAGELEKRP
jgi:hypothetical protein